MHSIVSGKNNKTYNIGVPKGASKAPDVGGGFLFESHGVELKNGLIVSALRPKAYIEPLPSDFVAELIIIPYDTVLTPFFTGIGRSGGKCAFYYGSEKIYDLTDTEHRVALLGDKIYIFPEKLCFTENGMESMEKSAFGYFDFYADGTVKREDFDFSEFFKKGDSVKISGSENDTFEGDDPYEEAPPGAIASAVVAESGVGEMKLYLTDSCGAELSFTEIEEECTISLVVPDLRCVCTYRNRLWGTVKGAPGRFIHASSPGNGLAFGRFSGTSADSWWGEVSSPGSFSACTAFGTHAVFFKKNNTHFLYGTSPESFSLPFVSEGGCINGKTVAEASGCLYYQGLSGIMELSGTSARCISEHMPNLSKAISGTSFMGNYYLAAEDGLYCYYPDKRQWLCIEKERYDAICASGTYFIGMKGNRMVVFSDCSGDGFMDSVLVSGRIILPDSPPEGVISALFTSDIRDGKLKFYIDSGAGYEKAGESDGLGIVRCRVPVRLRYAKSFRYKIEGTGDYTLLGVEVTT